MARVFASLMTFIVEVLLVEHLVFARVERRIFKWPHQMTS